MFIETHAPSDVLIEKVLPLIVGACEILRQEYQQYCSGGTFDIHSKKDDSPVTQADFRVNHYLTEGLKQVSDLPLLSEEGDKADRKQWQAFWLLDPLDGTKEFLHQRPQFTINLSLIEGSHTTFAMLAVPEEQSVYICPKAGLPLKYQINTQAWWQYQASSSKYAVQVGLSQSSQQKGQYAEYLAALEQITPYSVFKAGSAYKFCMMLEDLVDLYPRFHPTCEWDTSAGQCLIERIGGGLIDFHGRPFSYNQRETLLNGGFLAYKTLEMKKLALQALGRMSYKH